MKKSRSKTNRAPNQYTEHLNLIIKTAKRAVPTYVLKEKFKRIFQVIQVWLFSVSKNCCSKKVFKGRLVVVPQSTGQIYRKLLESYSLQFDAIRIRLRLHIRLTGVWLKQLSSVQLSPRPQSRYCGWGTILADPLCIYTGFLELKVFPSTIWLKIINTCSSRKPVQMHIGAKRLQPSWGGGGGGRRLPEPS